MKIIFLLLSLVTFVLANVGVVVDVVGDSTLLRNGKNIKVVQKLELKEHDFIKTSKNAKLKLFFKDDTAVSLGKNTSFEIDSYIFTGKSNSNIQFKVLKGFFKTVTGKIATVAPDKFKLKTKTATIGIRGTVFAAEVTGGSDVVVCTDGKIVMFTPSGDIEVPSGDMFDSRGDGSPRVTHYTQAQKEALIKNAGWHGSMSLLELIEYIKNNFSEPLRSQLLSTLQNILDKDSDERELFNQTSTINADDISFVDDITLNGRGLDSFEQREIEFYKEDLEEGRVVVQGLLESEDKGTSVEELFVEISSDGGATWSRASGHEEWEWTFAPKLEETYSFSLRVVKDTKGASDVGVIFAGATDIVNDYVSDVIPDYVPDSITIAGFTLNLNEDVSLLDGKITGSGSIEVPYLEELTNLTSNSIDVSFEELSITEDMVTLGDITYERAFTISTPIADINIEKIVFSPNSANHKIVGEVVYKNELASTFGTQRLPDTSKILPTSFDIDIPFTSKTLDIWKEQDVKLVIASGSVGLTYTLGDALPNVDFRIPAAQFQLGKLLKYANGVSAEVAMADFGTTPSFTLANETFLLDTGIKLPLGLNVSFDLSDYTNLSISFSSSADLTDYSNAMAQSLTNATLSATASKTGLSATLTADSALNPITIIDRGSDAEDVRLVFLGDKPSITIEFANEGSPSFELSDVSAELHFGDLLQDATSRATGIVAPIGDIKAPNLEISDAVYLLGSDIKLPNGFNASVDLSDLNAPKIAFSDIDVDFSSYKNMIAQHISGAKINAILSIADGFSASISSELPSPITIYEEYGVKLNFLGDSGPSFGIDIHSTESLPDFSISGINAEMDFGTLLNKAIADGENVVASLGVITKDDVEFLKLSLPANIKLLQSKLSLLGTYADLDLSTQEINIESSVNFDAYENNPILNALSGSKFESTISSTGFSGTITVQDELEPIDIWAEKAVTMTIAGKPMLGVYIDSSGVSFDFGALSASVNMGTLLLDASSKAVVAELSSALNDAGSYTASIATKTYLMGSQFALDTLEIGFNPNIRNISLSSSVDLSAYTNPVVKAFNGAKFTAAVSSTGFSGSLSKEGGFEPIVILDRGDKKDVTLEFTSSPTISVDILTSGIDFGFRGGSAELHFGDLLNDETVILTSLRDGVYSWGMSEKTKLFSEGKAYISEVKNAFLDIADIKNPTISFDATVDLSEYRGILASVKEANLTSATISKSGFSGSISASLGTVDIWQEKNVKLAFKSNPTINLGLTTSGVSIGFSNLDAEIDFGDLLVYQDSMKSAVATLGNALDPSSYTWAIEGDPIPLFGSEILLSTLGGSVDLSDISNPSITLEAMANLSAYGSVFEYVTAAELKEVTISKSGFNGSLAAELTRIPVFTEYGVYINFLESPEFYLSINTSGLKVGATNLNAEVELGELLSGSKAELKSMSGDLYSWNIEDVAGSVGHQVADTALYLKELSGQIDFANLKNPIINLNAVGDLSGYGDNFKGISLSNATISKAGFSGDLSVSMNDITLYEEGLKKAELKFTNGTSPTLNVVLTREEFSVGLSDLNAKIAFTNILDNQALNLIPYLSDDIAVESKYSWKLEGDHDFINDENGVIPITSLLGSIDLSDWQNPIVTFHTSANFTNYSLPGGIHAGVAVVDAEIKRTKIEWNLAITGASAEYTILDLGEKADDVRVELNDIEANVGSGGASVGAGAGMLYFGKLFDGAKEIEITYKNSSGLKTYGFSFDEEVVYKKDDNNFITFNGLNGDLIELSSGSYKVVLRGNAVAHSSLLNAISIDTLAITSLEIDSTKLSGDISASWSDFSIPILTDKATLSIRKVAIHIDSSKFTTMPITLKTFDGDLDLKAIFDGNDAKAALAFATATASSSATIGWSFADTKELKINENYIFKNLSGTLDLHSLDSLSIGLSGNFAYKGIEKDITLNNFSISSTGILGSISLNEKVNLFSNLDLTSLGVTFAGASTSGTAKLAYANSSFLSTGSPLKLNLMAEVDKTGIKSFALDTTGTNLTSINVANFAKFNFTTVTASSSMDDFWVSFDGNIKAQHPVFKSASPLEFKALKISNSGVTIDSAGADVNITGASGSIGALSMSLTSLGMGFEENRFYLSASGSIDIQIAKAAAGVKLYSSGRDRLVVNNIEVDIKQSALAVKGSLEWYRDDGIYGDGFHVVTSMTIAEVFEANGELRIGQKGDIFYWFASASGGPADGIPFGSVTFYTIGGGVGYHMRYDDETADFVPHATISSLMLTTTLGTTADKGYLWHGDVRVIAGFESSGALSQIDMIGKSWVLSEKSEKPADRKIKVEITYAKNTIHLKGSALVVYKKIRVDGKIDVLFSPEEKHVFIGTDPEYSYAFNITDQLGHVSVKFLGIDANGFFMVDTNAIAFGQGIHIDKKWSKSWWGPDPSLYLKLDAESKALIVYRPRFQMNLDVGVEVGLKACYGGCVDLGASVLLKLATPDPNYLYAKTRIYIFGTSIGFKGYIYKTGHPTLQAASEQVTPDVFEKVEPVNMDIGIMPIFKVYSSFAKSQPIDIVVHDVVLTNFDNRSDIVRFDANTTLSGDRKGASYIPTTVLKPSTRYILNGLMTATYVADGKTETKTETFTHEYQTGAENRVAFLDIVNTISPSDNEQNIHEDKGVKIYYNREVMNTLGANSSYVTDYKIKLFDADDNPITGKFTSTDGSFISKFQPDKDLRVYLYCVNEEGVVRETFVQDGHYLNPFNGFIVDRGDTTMHSLNDEITTDSMQTIGDLGTATLYNQGSEATMGNILAQGIDEEESGDSSLGDRSGLGTQRVIAPKMTLPSYIRINPVVLKSPEALGELITVKRDRGRSYSYYRANTYKIKVIYKPEGEDGTLAYSSSFKIAYNNIAEESKRKIVQMEKNLHPTLTVSLDENRIGATGVTMVPLKTGVNDSFFTEIRTEDTTGLEEIGVYVGVKTKIIGSWTIKREDGSVDTIVRELTERHVFYNSTNAFKLPGVLLEYSAQMQYILKKDDTFITKVDMELISGEPFSAAEEAEERRKTKEHMDGVSKKIKEGSGRVGELDGLGDPGGGFGTGSGGRFGQTGGGIGEAGDQYGDDMSGDLDQSGGDFDAGGFEVIGSGDRGSGATSGMEVGSHGASGFDAGAAAGAAGAAAGAARSGAGSGTKIIINTGF